MKKILIFPFILFLFLLPFLLPKINAQTHKQQVIVFTRENCVHCQTEEKFLDSLVKKRQDVSVTKYQLEKTGDRKLWEDFTTRLKIPKVAPITVVGEDYLIGFDKAETTGKEITELIDTAKKNNLATNLNKVKIVNGHVKSENCPGGTEPCSVDETPQSYSVTLPFLGKIDTRNYPLFILSALLGFVDGFNPCAMWVLITFLIILIEVGDRKKMFAFAGTFILAEAIMYSLILTLWYKTWDFVKLDAVVTPIVGIVSIIGGFFFLREWRKKEIECKVTNLEQRQKTRQKIQELAIAKFSIYTFIAILAIAFSVNIIEFACSVGIPQAFTKILELNRLSFLQTAGHITTYIFFYMIDDLVVFAVALYGAEKLALTTKYSKYSNLIGGILMIMIGLLLIFKPDLLLF